MEITRTPKSDSWEYRFVTTVIERCMQNKGLAARLRRADNAATEYQSWDLLASLNVDLERDDVRLPFVTIAAAIAKAKIETNGKLTLGRAIADCYEDGSENHQSKARLRRLLACDDIEELVRILRPLFSLISSKVSQPLDFVKLLRQLRFFSYDSQAIKAQWAQEFYGKSVASFEKKDES
jgi:CRISPR system Cascade subunit CasB